MSYFDIQDITRLLEFEFYNIFSYKGMVQLNELSRYLQRDMGKIKVPVFVLQSRKDKTVSPISGRIIFNSCKNSIFRSILFIANAGHVLVLERRRYFVFEKIEEFMKRVNSKFYSEKR